MKTGYKPFSGYVLVEKIEADEQGNGLIYVDDKDKPNAKLNADLVREIRNRYAQKQSGIRQMARDYNVSHTTILDVVKGEIWSHIV